MERKPLESLDHELFEDLSEELLGYACGGIIASTSDHVSSTHFGRIVDEEFLN